MSDIDPRSALAALAAARGDSLAALSVMLGRNLAYLQQYVRRGTPRVLSEEDRRTLSAYFGVADEMLGGPPPAAAGLALDRLDVAASAGPGALLDRDVAIGTETIDAALARRLGLRAGHATVIRVRGTSMEPGLFDGDHIVVDMTDRRPSAQGRLYVIRLDGTIMVKRVAMTAEGLTAHSDNPSAAPLPAGEIDVIGRVVWQMRAPI